MKPTFFTFFVCALFIISCAQQDEKRIRDRAEVEGRVANKVEQDAINERAKKMEADLANRHYFYGAIEGTYLGSTQFEDQTYSVKFTFVRTIPPYLDESRIRQISEIENDLNNLSFSIQVIQWHPDDMSTAVGCRVNQIRPDMQKGIMTISSPDCPNLYTVLLSDLLPINSNSSGEIKEKARGIAEKLKKRESQTVDVLTGTIQPTSNANIFNFSVKRMD